MQQCATCETSESSSAQNVRADWVGACCSVGCGIHCAAMPVLLSWLPSIGLVQWLAQPIFHQLVSLVCTVLAWRAILPGMRLHRDRCVGLLAGAGIGLLVLGAFILPDKCCIVCQPTRHRGEDGQQFVFSNQPVLTLISNARVPPSPRTHPSVNLQEEMVLENRCRLFSDCAWNNPLGTPLLTREMLEARLGEDCAHELVSLQPYLAPCGGLLLVIAHIVNIRLKCCRPRSLALGGHRNFFDAQQ